MRHNGEILLIPCLVPKASRSSADSKQGARPGQIRIIGGKWRRRRLGFPERPGLRPTPDRVRETLFNWLGQNLDGFSCLDLYAGSGALGFEALSRGASRVTMIERDLAAARNLEHGAQSLEATGLKIICADALEFLNRIARRERYDLIFVDPPFAMGLPPGLMALLPGALEAGGRVFLESNTRQELQQPWRLEKSGKAGKVHFQLLGRESE
jgi:16S rRNA (guanine966-N2)-methyltransferase